MIFCSTSVNHYLKSVERVPRWRKEQAFPPSYPLRLVAQRTLYLGAQKTIAGQRIKWGIQTLLDLGYADDLSILDKNVSKMNEILGVLRVQGTRTGLKINVKKTKSMRLGISEGEEVLLGKGKIDQVDNFTYLGSTINENGDCNGEV